MKFTETNVAFHAAGKIPVDTGSEQGYLTPIQLVLPALQGAAGDPTKIGEEYMPQTITSSVKVANTSAVALPPGTIGGTASAIGLVVHDGARIGGYSLPVGFDDLNIRSLAVLPNASVVAGDAVAEIARFKLPAAWFVNGQLVYFMAEITLAGTNYAGSEISVGIHVAGETNWITNDEYGKGIRLFPFPGTFAAPQTLHAVAYAQFDNATTGSFVLTGGSVLAGEVVKVATATAAIPAPYSSEFAADGGAAGDDIIITLRAAQDAAMTGSPIIAGVNLKAIKL